MRDNVARIRRGRNASQPLTPQERNDFVDAVLHAIGQHPASDPAITKSAVHLDMTTIENGVTAQHRLAALRD